MKLTINPEDYLSKQRLDYILVVDPKQEEFQNDVDTDVSAENQEEELAEVVQNKPSDYKKLSVDLNSTKVEPNFTPTNPENGLPILPFSQISDHYGISCEINYND